jgi:hypothetical protein
MSQCGHERSFAGGVKPAARRSMVSIVGEVTGRLRHATAKWSKVISTAGVKPEQ